MPKPVKMFDGTVINFPDDMDDKAIHAEGLKYYQAKQPKPKQLDMGAALQMEGSGSYTNEDLNKARDPVIDAVRPIVATGAATLAAPLNLATGGVPIASAGAYTGADLLLQKLKKEQKPTGAQLIDTALQGLLGKIFDVGGKAIGAVRNSGVPADILKFSPTTSQAMAAEGIPGSSVAKFLEDTLAPGAKTEALKRSGKATTEIGESVAGRIAGRNPTTISNPQQMSQLALSEMAPEQELKMVAGKMVPKSEMPAAYEILPGIEKKVPFATDPASLDKLIAQPEKLQQALTKSQQAGLGINVKQDLAGYRFSRILQDATDEAGNFNATAAKAAFTDPMMIESNKILFNSTNRSNIEQFFKNAEFANVKSATGPAAQAARFIMRGGMAVLPMKLMYSALSGNTAMMASAAGVAGIELAGSQLAKLLTKPETARIMIRLAGAEPLGMSDQFAAKLILRGLQGTKGFLVGKDGEKQEVGF